MNYESPTYNARRASLGLFGEANQADPEPTYAELLEPVHARGFTRHIMAMSDGADFCDLWIKPDADLDGTFRAYDAEEDEWVKVNGWLFSIEEV